MRIVHLCLGHVTCSILVFQHINIDYHCVQQVALMRVNLEYLCLESSSILITDQNYASVTIEVTIIPAWIISWDIDTLILIMVGNSSRRTIPRNLCSYFLSEDFVPRRLLCRDEFVVLPKCCFTAIVPDIASDNPLETKLFPTRTPTRTHTSIDSPLHIFRDTKGF